MNNYDLFQQLYNQLSEESQRRLLDMLKGLSQQREPESEKQSQDFQHIDYRSLYYTLFYETGRTADQLVSTLHRLEEIHLQEPEGGTIINLFDPEG